LQQTQNTGNFRNWVISGNTIQECSGNFIEIDGAFYSPTITNNVLKSFSGSSGVGIDLLGTTRAQITGNYFENITPVRIQNDTQSTPVAPNYTILTNNIWDNNSGFQSVISGTNLVRQSNIKIGQTNLIISSGAVTAVDGVQYAVIDTEGAAASDDLDTINEGSVGDIVTFRAASSFRTVVFKDGTGNLRLQGDLSLDNNEDTITLINTGSFWAEVCRSNNGA
jgi:hypothetical protein